MIALFCCGRGARAFKIIVVYCRLLMSITGVVRLEMLCNTSRKIYNSTAMLEACDIIIVDDDNSGDLVLWEIGSGDRNLGVALGGGGEKR